MYDVFRQSILFPQEKSYMYKNQPEISPIESQAGFIPIP